MCTVSVVRAAGRVRLMCNRDERHDRPQAFAPVVRRVGGHLALHPVDPAGGGTWIAVTSAGLAFAVLNGDGPVVPSAPSRGRIVLRLLACATLDDAVAAASAVSRHAWSPYRLLLTDGDAMLDMRVAAGRQVVRERRLDRATMFTSSSLGEAVVAPHRQALFDSMVGGASDLFDAQDAFHRHRWPDRPHLSVHMRRHDAATQSLTTLDLTARALSMRYEPATDVIGQPAMLSVDRRQTARLSPVLVPEATRAAVEPSLAAAS